MGVVHALALAERGFRVFPLSANGTRPVFEGWTEDASCDPQTVIDLFCQVRTSDGQRIRANYDPGYNVGVLTTGMLVLDVDTKEGRSGWASFMRYAPDINTFTVETKSGGRHFYYSTLGTSFQNTAGTLGEGLDSRSYHGYVVGPGSVVDGKAYRVINDTGFALAPAEVLVRMKTPRARTQRKPFEGEDDPHNVLTASHVAETLEPAVVGEQSVRAFDAGCLMRDYGLSEPMAVQVLAEMWNPRNEPPLTLEDLATRVENAYKYALRPAGSRTAKFSFEGFSFKDGPGGEWAEGDEAPAHPGRTHQGGNEDLPRGFRPLLPAEKITPRAWIANDFLISGGTTVMSAPGATGKTQVLLTVAALLAAGRPSLLGYTNAMAGIPVKSLIYTAEDDRAELSRRLAAICQHYKLDEAEVLPHVLVMSGRDDGTLVLAKTNVDRTPEVVQSSIDLITEAVNSHGPFGLIALDPLTNLHDLDENSAPHMRFVMELVNGLATATKAACLVMHHTAKSSDGTVSGTRGSSAIINSARIAVVLNPLDEDEARELGIPERDSPFVSWIGAAKNNQGAKSFKRRWYIMRGVTLHTGDTMGVPADYDAEGSTSMADEALCRALKEYMQEEQISHLPGTKAVTVARDVLGNALLGGMSAQAARRQLTQIINRQKTYLEVGPDGAVFLYGTSRSQNVVPFGRPTL